MVSQVNFEHWSFFICFSNTRVLTCGYALLWHILIFLDWSWHDLLRWISSYGMQVLVKRFLNSQSIKEGLGPLTFLKYLPPNWPVEVMTASWNCGALVRHAYSLSLSLSFSHSLCHRCSTTIKLIFNKSSVTLYFLYCNDFDRSCWYSFRYGDVLPCDSLSSLIFVLLVIWK